MITAFELGWRNLFVPTHPKNNGATFQSRRPVIILPPGPPCSPPGSAAASSSGRPAPRMSGLTWLMIFGGGTMGMAGQLLPDPAIAATVSASSAFIAMTFFREFKIRNSKALQHTFHRTWKYAFVTDAILAMTFAQGVHYRAVHWQKNHIKSVRANTNVSVAIEPSRLIRIKLASQPHP